MSFVWHCDRHLPAVIWAQRNDKLYVTINVEDCQNAVVNFDDNKLTFRYDRCYDHEFVIVSPIDSDHGCIPIGWRDH